MLQGTLQSKQLFSLGCFEGCFQFLTGFSLSEDLVEVDRTKQKKWTASQTRELTELHCLLAYLVLACDTSSHVSTGECDLCVLTVLLSSLLQSVRVKSPRPRSWRCRSVCPACSTVLSPPSS